MATVNLTLTARVPKRAKAFVAASKAMLWIFGPFMTDAAVDGFVNAVAVAYADMIEVRAE